MTLVRTKDEVEGRGSGDRVYTRYEDDPFTWAREQAALLLEGRFDLIDASNLADEIETLTHYLADKLRSDLVRVIQHLLKWDHQSVRRSRSWFLSIQEHRRRVGEHLDRAPGLRSILPELTRSAFRTARSKVLKETALSEGTLPGECPYDWDAIMTREIPWPEAT